MMSPAKGITVLFLTSLFAMPMMAGADRGRDEASASYGDECYEHKGKIKCRSGKGNVRQHAGGPPPWAPAHGWRRKQEGGEHGNYAGYDDYYIDEQSGVRTVIHGGSATVDVGISNGSCNRKAVGTVLGGLIGGAIGNRAGDSRNREITTVLGAVIGGLVGHNIGRSMDQADQHCTGQILEQAPDHHTVRWADEAHKGEYRVTPEHTWLDDGRYCRDYLTEYRGENGIEREKGSACRTQDGAWQKIVM
jgi:surface antigen